RSLYKSRHQLAHMATSEPSPVRKPNHGLPEPPSEQGPPANSPIWPSEVPSMEKGHHGMHVLIRAALYAKAFMERSSEGPWWGIC
ncbi:unnamed protein product, partial [Penicillium egyptiacum]